MERLPPKPSTLKALFARSGNQCAFYGCDRPIIDELCLFVGEVCHIFPVRSGEARYRDDISDEELRSFENLILLCHAHHVRIDSDEKTYTADVLKEMRQQHYTRIGNQVYRVSEFNLDDAMIKLLKSEWEPFVEPIVNYLLVDLGEGYGGQQGMNRLSRYIGDLLDAKLYFILLRLLAETAPAERGTVLRDHLEWMERREADSQAAVESHGGSLAPLEYNLAYKEITEKRIRDLERAKLGEEGAAGTP